MKLQVVCCQKVITDNYYPLRFRFILQKQKWNRILKKKWCFVCFTLSSRLIPLLPCVNQAYLSTILLPTFLPTTSYPVLVALTFRDSKFHYGGSEVVGFLVGTNWSFDRLNAAHALPLPLITMLFSSQTDFHSVRRWSFVTKCFLVCS